MNITIKATNTSLTDAIRNNVEEKMSSLEDFLRPEEIVRVEIAEEKHHDSGLPSRVEVHITPHGHYAEAMGKDFYEAIDLVIPKIKHQLVKEKDKRISERRTGVIEE